MKNKRYRNIKKVMEFYSINFNFTKPLKIIIDGTFMKKDIELNYNFQFKIKKLLKTNCEFYTTDCILKELKYLGEPLRNTLNNSILLKKLKCEHNNNNIDLSGKECIKKHLGFRNTQDYSISTQDKNLLQDIKEYYKTPVFHFFNENQLNITPISFKTKSKLKKLKDKEYDEIKNIIKDKKQLKKQDQKEKRAKLKKEINSYGIKIKKNKYKNLLSKIN